MAAKMNFLPPRPSSTLDCCLVTIVSQVNFALGTNLPTNVLTTRQNGIQERNATFKGRLAIVFLTA